MKKFSFVILSFILISCTNDNVEAKFIEIKDNIARFDIVNNNNNNRDIGKITFEIKFLDKLENILLIDTISYQMSKEYDKDSTPFLKANDNTFIVQTIPDQCEKADIRVLKIDYID